MLSDPIIEEVRRVRQEYARRFNYDLHAIAADLRKKEQEHPERSSLFRRRNVEPSGITLRVAVSSGLVHLLEDEAVLVGVDADGVAVEEFAGEQLQGERVLDLLLDRPLQRPGAVDRVVALLHDPVRAWSVNSSLILRSLSRSAR